MPTSDLKLNMKIPLPISLPGPAALPVTPRRRRGIRRMLSHHHELLMPGELCVTRLPLVYAMWMTRSLIVRVSGRKSQKRTRLDDEATSEWKIHKRVLNIRVTQSNRTLSNHRVEPFAGRRGKKTKASDEAHCREQEESSLGSSGETRKARDAKLWVSFLAVTSHRYANRKRRAQADERQNENVFCSLVKGGEFSDVFTSIFAPS